MRLCSFVPHALVCLALAALCACSPALDWREVNGGTVPFTVLLPAKPATFSRPINLAGTSVTMTMTAAEVSGVSYAVGTAQMPSAQAAAAALPAMKTALVNNIGGKVVRDSSAASATASTAGGTKESRTLEVEARGMAGGATPRLLVARFIARDKRVYQVLINGPEKQITREAIDTFFTSFKAPQ